MNNMQEIADLIKRFGPFHFELGYNKVADWLIDLRKKGVGKNGEDIVIFREQNIDSDYLLCKCLVAFKDWLIEINGGY